MKEFEANNLSDVNETENSNNMCKSGMTKQVPKLEDSNNHEMDEEYQQMSASNKRIIKVTLKSAA